MKKILAIVLALVMVFSLAACGSSNNSSAGSADQGSSEAPAPAQTEDKEVTLKLGHMRAEGSPTDADVKEFAQRVEEQTNGTVKIEIYANSTLGDYTAMVERMGVGDVDMMLAAIGTALDQRFAVPTVPYLVSTWEEAKTVFGEGSLVLECQRGGAQANDFDIIGTYPMYFGGIGLAKPMTADITNFEKQGIKIRVPAIAAFDALATEFGFMGTPLNYSDIFTSMQTGVVDGTIGGGAEGYYNDFRELLNQYLCVNDHFEMQWLCLADATLEKLSENQLAILKENAKWLEEKRWAEAEESQAKFEQMLADEGIDVVRFTDEELEAFKNHMRENMWGTTMREALGDDLYTQVCDMIGFEG